MGIVAALIIGLLVGALARMFAQGDDGRGLVVSMALGVAGALGALYLGRHLGCYGPGDGPGILGSSLGASLLVIGYRLLRRAE